MRKYMIEILAEQNNLMNFVEGIYKNQKLMLYWINDQEQRLALAEATLNQTASLN
jgi:hypothetical protein